MNKKALCFIFTSLLFFVSYASEIKIAPIAVYDSNGNRTTPPFSPSDAIYTALEKRWFEGLVHFSLISENNHGLPVTIIDANKICIAEDADYLIYGYIRKNEASWLSEIKLYSVSEKKIIKEFFASDSVEHYDRLINVLCQKYSLRNRGSGGIQPGRIKEAKKTPYGAENSGVPFLLDSCGRGLGKQDLGNRGRKYGA